MLNIVSAKLRNKETLKIYKDMHIFSLNIILYLRTWVFSQLIKLISNNDCITAISKIKKWLIIYYLQSEALDEVIQLILIKLSLRLISNILIK